MQGPGEKSEQFITEPMESEWNRLISFTVSGLRCKMEVLKFFVTCRRNPYEKGTDNRGQ